MIPVEVWSQRYSRVRVSDGAFRLSPSSMQLDFLAAREGRRGMFEGTLHMCRGAVFRFWRENNSRLGEAIADGLWTSRDEIHAVTATDASSIERSLQIGVANDVLTTAAAR